MNSNKSQQIKNIVAKIDLDKIASYPQHPKSQTLRRIIRYSQRIQDSENNEEIFRLAVDTAYNLDIIVNVSKYVENEEEKKYWLKVAEEIFENTVGVKKIK